MVEKRTFPGSGCFVFEDHYGICYSEMNIYCVFNKLVGKTILLEVFFYKNGFVFEIMEG